MNSQQILDSLEQWAQNKDFTAPYGILTQYLYGSYTADLLELQEKNG